jgi:hypothetical protein
MLPRFRGVGVATFATLTQAPLRPPKLLFFCAPVFLRPCARAPVRPCSRTPLLAAMLPTLLLAAMLPTLLLAAMLPTLLLAALLPYSAPLLLFSRANVRVRARCTRDGDARVVQDLLAGPDAPAGTPHRQALHPSITAGDENRGLKRDAE